MSVDLPKELLAIKVIQLEEQTPLIFIYPTLP